jgi:F-type H+-transporting ATPase subunit gamma
MLTLEGLRRRIAATQGLQSVVKTMKVLAAVSIRQYEQAVVSLEQYNQTVETGFQVVLKNRAPVIPRKVQPTTRTGAIVFGSEQGLVGQFNERIASHTIRVLNALDVPARERAVLVVGMRVGSHLEAAGQPVEEYFDVPGSLTGITPLVQDIVLKIEAWVHEQGIERVYLCYNRTLSAATYEPHSLQLLPMDMEWLQGLRREPWPTRAMPTSTMDWDKLFTALFRQYLFVSLYRACAESLAGENASRLAAMQAAERNIEERLEELHTQYHYMRQSSITEELLDIVAGFEVLAVKKRKRGEEDEDIRLEELLW